MTPADLIAEAAALLSSAGVDPARFEAQIILAQVLGTKPSRVLLETAPVSSAGVARFRELVQRRATRTPLQYVLGTHDFMGLTLACMPGVFIPRPETELLVECAVEILTRRRGRMAIADLGCGTGAVAVALAHHLPGATVFAVDVSPVALRITAENARRIGVGDRIQGYQGDLLAPLVADGLADNLNAIVANLPYIPSGDIADLQPEVRDHEPSEALDGGPDGLDHFRRLAGQIRDLPSRERLVALEVGMGQAAAVVDVLTSALGGGETEVRSDYSGIERIVLAHLRGSDGG